MGIGTMWMMETVMLLSTMMHITALIRGAKKSLKQVGQAIVILLMSTEAQLYRNQGRRVRKPWKWI
jgi:hypothetical protein